MNESAGACPSCFCVAADARGARGKASLGVIVLDENILASQRLALTARYMYVESRPGEHTLHECPARRFATCTCGDAFDNGAYSLQQLVSLLFRGS
jgi:hypothetical protein